MAFRFFLGTLLLFSSLRAVSQTAADAAVVQNSPGTVWGKILDDHGVAVSHVKVELRNREGTVFKQSTTTMTGEFRMWPVEPGDYTVSVAGSGFKNIEKQLHLAMGSSLEVDLRLDQDPGRPKELIMDVKESRNMIHKQNTTHVTEVTREQIAQLPQGDTIELNDLIGETTAGVGESSLKMLVIHGYYGKFQYRIDGFALPDSPDNELGETFAAKNIDHVEVLTGGFPAEYGGRLGAVVDITMKSGTENANGMAELNYGSFNTIAPYGTYSWPNDNGDRRSFLSLQYSQTDRGLDTPEPAASNDVNHGGTDVVHDHSYKASGFYKTDWVLNNENKISLILSESFKFFQIPNYPSSWSINDPRFNPSIQDPYQNGAYIYTPSTTDDSQTQNDAFALATWRHRFSDTSFLQTLASYKYSSVQFSNDPTNDLYSVASPLALSGATAASYSEDRHVNILSLESNYTLLMDEAHRLKVGVKLQASQADGPVALIAGTTGSPLVYTSLTDLSNATYESAYVQDDCALTEKLSFNAGLRFDAVQFQFTSDATQSALFEPRLGINYMLTQQTKLHAFYGRFFMPAPVEDFRASYAATQSVTGPSQCPAGQLCTYDIKAEVDDSFEVGVDQELGSHLLKLSSYYRHGSNALDDQQLLNTNLLQPVNYIESQAYGIDLSVAGKLAPNWSDFLNYSYNISQVRGINGGIFAMPPGQFPIDQFVALDEEQLHTVSSGATWATDQKWCTLQALYGSGFHTGPNNTSGLPGHFTLNSTIGYKFEHDSKFSGFKTSVDVMNIFDNHYVIALQNNFNSNHYAAGREWMVHLAKEF